MSNTRKLKKPSPTLIAKGSYAIYESPSGEGVVAYRPEGAETDSHQVIPRNIWQIVQRLLRGETIDANPVSLMKMMMGGK